jgi:hypothetical protein
MIVFVLIISMILTSGTQVQAGKPTPQPYPQPVQGDAYPEPLQGLPAPQPPDAPTGFCDGPLPRWCAWGYIGEWYATLQGAGTPEFSLPVIMCTALQGVPEAQNCQEMRWQRWNSYTDTNVFTAPPMKHECTPFGTTPAYIIYTYAQYYGMAEIIEPNEYVIRCMWLPLAPRIY